MENFGLTTEDTLTNSSLAVVFSDGQISHTNEGVLFQCPIPKLFRIPNECTFVELKRRISQTLELQGNMEIVTLYYRKPQYNVDSVVVFEVSSLENDSDVTHMLSWSMSFPSNFIIEVYCIYSRSTEQIVSLMSHHPSSSSSTSRSQTMISVPAIIYFGGPIQQATIKDCPYGFGLMFKSLHPKTMNIQQSWTYNELVEHIEGTMGYGDRKRVKRINYRRPHKVVDNKLIHDVVVISNDRHVQKM